ncbi:MAG TPA: branched-chain amino acid transaminase [Candidatus Limnocylindrales bacterium]|nr:branched-chain amino acid transaminase [Candidatus Limnocylindrales bacterium]
MTAVEPRPASTPAELGAWAYFEGAVVPIGEANVSIATHTFNYGTAVFEGIRAYRQGDGSTAILFAREHYERMLRNARLLRASVPESADDLVEITRDLLRRNAHDGDAYIRPLVYKSARSIRVKLTGLDDRVALFTIPLGDYLPTGGIRVTVSGWQRVSDNAIPARGKVSGSYVNAAFAAEDAHAGGYDDAILLTGDGHVAEASAANIFVVRGNEVATPPLTDDVLAGITRTAILRIAADADLDVVERRIDRSELYLADEVFLTGTGVQVAPISSIDDRPVGTGEFPISLDIQRRYFAAVRGSDERYASWLTPI